MPSRRVTYYSLLIAAVLAALVGFIVIMPGGSAGISASSGFMAPFSYPVHMIAYALLGLLAARLRIMNGLMLPVAFALMLTLGAATTIAMLSLPFTKTLIFASALLFAGAVGAAYSRQFLLLTCLISAPAFYYGATYMIQAGEQLAPLSYLIGCISAVSLTMAMGASLGVALKDSSLFPVQLFRRHQRV